MDDSDGRVQERAYAIWETEGRPEGRETEHWLQAEREVSGEALAREDGMAGAGEAEGSAEGGIEDKLRRDEARDPSVPGAATLVEAG